MSMAEQICGYCNGPLPHGGITGRDESWCPKKPTEMASLREIKAKLDYISSSLATLFGAMDVLAESQGKLLEAISGLRESGMRNHQQIMFHMRPKRKKGKRR